MRWAGRSAILKVVAHSAVGHENWRSGEEQGHWYYWRREPLAYETGLLRSLTGGLRAPNALAVVERPDGSVALWLQDLDGLPGSEWPIHRYGVASRHLGQTQGTYLAGSRLPDDPWLSRGWLRSYLRQRGRRSCSRSRSEILASSARAPMVPDATNRPDFPDAR